MVGQKGWAVWCTVYWNCLANTNWTVWSSVRMHLWLDLCRAFSHLSLQIISALMLYYTDSIMQAQSFRTMKLLPENDWRALITALSSHCGMLCILKGKKAILRAKPFQWILNEYIDLHGVLWLNYIHALYYLFTSQITNKLACGFWWQVLFSCSNLTLSVTITLFSLSEVRVNV